MMQGRRNEATAQGMNEMTGGESLDYTHRGGRLFRGGQTSSRNGVNYFPASFFIFSSNSAGLSSGAFGLFFGSSGPLMLRRKSSFESMPSSLNFGPVGLAMIAGAGSSADISSGCSAAGS